MASCRKRLRLAEACISSEPNALSGFVQYVLINIVQRSTIYRKLSGPVLWRGLDSLWERKAAFSASGSCSWAPVISVLLRRARQVPRRLLPASWPQWHELVSFSQACSCKRGLILAERATVVIPQELRQGLYY